MDSKRLQRLMRRFLSRGRNYAQLRQARSLNQAVACAVRQPIDFLNGNALRAKVLQGLVEWGPCALFIETGTSHAATAIGVNRFLNLPVWSCEINRKDHLISRAVTFGLSGIELSNLDSRAFLRQAVIRLKALDLIPLFYLDAHEGTLDRDSLPLTEELNLILELDSLVVMMDDFRVPSADDFRWGTYGGIDVDIQLIRDQLLSSSISHCYFPAYASSTDTGYSSGYCLFWRAATLDEQLARGAFPFSLLRAISIGGSISWV